VVTIRLPVETIAGLDEMAGGRGRRSAFIRQMIDSHLQSFRWTKPPNRRATAKSSAMAGEQIDRLQHGKAATPEEREDRKRRLLKGPKEFRDMRAPKVKE
jgi:metal-responsive CopG/Arc/MetJ family transcriptional regulator